MKLFRLMIDYDFIDGWQLQKWLLALHTSRYEKNVNISLEITYWNKYALESLSNDTIKWSHILSGSHSPSPSGLGGDISFDLENSNVS